MLVVDLDLKNHCVETEIKRQYNRALNSLLRSGQTDSVLEGRLELLRHALEKFNFSHLRNTNKVLAGGCIGNQIQLRGGSPGIVDLYINGKKVGKGPKQEP